MRLRVSVRFAERWNPRQTRSHHSSSYCIIFLGFFFFFITLPHNDLLTFTARFEDDLFLVFGFLTFSLVMQEGGFHCGVALQQVHGLGRLLIMTMSVKERQEKA